ncbi:MAG: DUF5702 domain-containing protein [Eubacterium sp.]|nr:DUF5702 domain-containing protein [Eubacterium sp.]
MYRKKKTKWSGVPRLGRGSITLFVSLLLLLLLGLIFAGLKSMRQAAARTAVVSGLEQGLYSVFAQYDRALFEEYGLLFIDGGYGSGDLRLDEVLRETENYAEYILDPTKNNLMGGSNLLSLELNREKCSVTGYVLAVDQENTPFIRQVCEQMKLQAGEVLLRKIAGSTSSQGENADRLRKKAGTWHAGNAREYYNRDVAQGLCPPVPVIARSEKKEENAGRGEKPESEGVTAEQIAAEFGGGVVPVWNNPLVSYNQLRGRGILKLVFQDESVISGKNVNQKLLMTERECSSGMGMQPTEWNGTLEKTLLQEFLLADFPCYTDSAQQKVLSYQVEYVIGGKKNDRDNLKAALSEMQLLRAASNLTFLMTDPERRSQADLLAAGISAALLNPELAPFLSFAIKVAWAYGESILDLQVLVEGGKIPLVKTADTWQLSIENIGRFSGAGREERKSSPGGLDYEDYLRVLLLARSEAVLAERIMNLTELNIREQKGKENFRLDHCIDAVTIEIGATVGNNRYQAERSYGYDLK